MDMTNLITEMKKEFQAKMDTAMAEELRRQELGEAELAALADVLPEVIIPQLSASDEKKALKIKDDLDNKVGKIVELTSQLCQVAADYKKQMTELGGLLNGKKHDIQVRHSDTRLKFMLERIGKILPYKLFNSLITGDAIPNKDYIEKELTQFRF